MTEQELKQQIKNELEKKLYYSCWDVFDPFRDFVLDALADQELRLRRLEQINKTKN